MTHESTQTEIEAPNDQLFKAAERRLIQASKIKKESGYMPNPTKKQIRYLARLIAEAGDDPQNVVKDGEALDRRQASYLIETYKVYGRMQTPQEIADEQYRAAEAAGLGEDYCSPREQYRYRQESNMLRGGNSRRWRRN